LFFSFNKSGGKGEREKWRMMILKNGIFKNL